MGKLLGLWLVVSACSETHVSTLPPYVRDLRAAVGGVEMIQCEVVVTTTHEHNWWGGDNKTTRAISDGKCWNQVVSTEPPPDPTQPQLPQPEAPR